MSGASSGDDSESLPEVPTEVPSDLEEGTASGAGVQGPSGPAATPSASATPSAPVVAADLRAHRLSRRPLLRSNAYPERSQTQKKTRRGAKKEKDTFLAFWFLFIS